MLNIHKHHHLSAQTGSLLTLENAAKTIPSSNNSAESIQEVLAALAEMLSTVQGQTANLQGERGQMNAGLQAILAQNLTNAANNIQNQIQHAEEQQQKESFWDKLINGIMAAVGAVISCFAPEIGVPMMLIAISNLTGLTDKVANCLSDVFEAMGANKQVANMLAQIVIFIAVTAASSGTSIGSDTPALAGAVKAVAALGEGLVMAPQLLSDIASVALTNSDMSDDAKKKLEQQLALAQAIIGALFMVSSGGAQFFSSACREVGASGTLASNLLKNLSSIGEKFSETAAGIALKAFKEQLQSMITQTGEVLARNLPKAVTKSAAWFAEIGAEPVGVLTQLGCTAGIGGANFSIEQNLANTQEAIAKNQAYFTITQSEMKTMNDDTTSDIQAFAQRLQNQSKMMASIIGDIEVAGQSYLEAASNL